MSDELLDYNLILFRYRNIFFSLDIETYKYQTIKIL